MCSRGCLTGTPLRSADRVDLRGAFLCDLACRLHGHADCACAVVPAQVLTAAALSKPFTIQTRWRPVFGPTPRYYAFVFTTDGKDLAELLVATASRESLWNADAGA